MSRYKTGDKVVYEFIRVNEDGSYTMSNNSEPLSTFTEPLEARIRRQAERITRLLAENKGLKEQVKVLSKQPDPKANAEREAGQSEAWDLARKIVLMDYEGGYTEEELTGMFGTGNDYYVFKENPTYAEAAAKVAEWEKKQEICVGDVVEYKSGDCGLVTRTYEMWVEGIKAEGTRFQWHKSFCKKTGRHIDVSAMLAQIGGEE